MAAGHIGEDEYIPQIKRHPWADDFFRPLLLIGMIMCFNISLVNLVRAVYPVWSGRYFLAGMLLTTVEGIYSQRYLLKQPSWEVPLVRYRLAEWFILVVVLRFLSMVGRPIWPQLVAIWQDPDQNLVTIQFMMILFLALTAWLMATYTITDFEDLHDPLAFRSDNILPLDYITRRFLWGGVILVGISGVTRWIVEAGAGSLFDFRRPSLGGILLNVLLYFVLGLILLSQAHLTTLLVRWQVRRITVKTDLTKQWARYGLLFLVVVMAAVFFLPTHYTLGFLATAGFIIQLILGLLLFIFRLLFFLMLLPFAWLQHFFGGEEAPPPEPLQFPPMAPSSAPPETASLPWLDLLRSIAFWGVGVALFVYLVRIYLSEHSGQWQRIKGVRLLASMWGWFKRMWQNLWSATRSGLELLPRPRLRWRRAASKEQAGSGRWWRWGRRSPRERILYYYLSILKRAESRPYARQSHQTPYEYAPRLGRAVPEAEPEVERLTEAFVQARYSPHDFEPEQAEAIKKEWQRVRRELRRERPPAEE